ncbi:MAG: hypothetical protein WD314_02940 [Trueperaceae bacterium]
MQLVPLMLLFNSKKSRRKRLSQAMAFGMMPVGDESQRQALTAVSADMEVRRAERAEEAAIRETAQLIARAKVSRIAIRDSDIAGAPVLRQALERNPSLRQVLNSAVGVVTGPAPQDTIPATDTRSTTGESIAVEST